MQNHFDLFVQRIIESSEFRRLNLFLHALKKAPHGGVFYINRANFFMNIYPVGNSFQVFFPRMTGEIVNRSVFRDVLCIVNELMDKSSISEEELFLAIRVNMPDDWWCASFCFDSTHKPGSNSYYATFFKALKECKPIDASITFNREKLQIVFIYSLACANGFSCINDILECEKLPVKADKYGLTDVTNARFDRDGYYLDGQYYLYNIFLDKSINAPMAGKPYIIEMLLSVGNASIYMRQDATLSPPDGNPIRVSTWDSQLFRGITITADRFMEIRNKTIIVHFDPKTNNKLYMSIVPMEATKPHILSIVIEELWNPDAIDDENVTTTFIHATYNRTTRLIEHMDLSINEYNREVYAQKHRDSVSTSTVAIDQYAESHYKVWCIKSETMNLAEWGRIAFASLSSPFRTLFKEMTEALFEDQT